MQEVQADFGHVAQSLAARFRGEAGVERSEMESSGRGGERIGEGLNCFHFPNDSSISNNESYCVSRIGHLGEFLHMFHRMVDWYFSCHMYCPHRVVHEVRR